MADWIWVPFGVVSVVSGIEKWVYQLAVEIVEWEGAAWGDVGHPIVINGTETRLFPNYFGISSCYGEH